MVNMNIIEIGKTGRFCLMTDAEPNSMGTISISLGASKREYEKFLKNSPRIICKTADELIDAIFEAKLFIKKIENSDVFIKTELFNG
jgi:hypothetical protein